MRDILKYHVIAVNRSIVFVGVFVVVRLSLPGVRSLRHGGGDFALPVDKGVPVQVEGLEVLAVTAKGEFA